MCLHNDFMTWRFPHNWSFFEGHPTGGFPSQRVINAGFDAFFNIGQKSVEHTLDMSAIWDTKMLLWHPRNGVCACVYMSANIQSAGDLVSGTPGSNPAFSRRTQLVSFRFEYRLPVPEHRNYNNKHVYRQSQVRKSTDSGVKWAECLLIIGTGCRVQVFF